MSSLHQTGRFFPYSCVNECRVISIDDIPALLTVLEAAAILRIGRTTAYQLAHEYRRTNGASGLPVVRVGKQLRVPRDRLRHLIDGTEEPSTSTNTGAHLATPAGENNHSTRLRLFET